MIFDIDKQRKAANGTMPISTELKA